MTKQTIRLPHRNKERIEELKENAPESLALNSQSATIDLLMASIIAGDFDHIRPTKTPKPHRVAVDQELYQQLEIKAKELGFKSRVELIDRALKEEHRQVMMAKNDKYRDPMKNSYYAFKRRLEGPENSLSDYKILRQKRHREKIKESE